MPKGSAISLSFGTGKTVTDKSIMLGIGATFVACPVVGVIATVGALAYGAKNQAKSHMVDSGASSYLGQEDVKDFLRKASSKAGK